MAVLHIDVDAVSPECSVARVSAESLSRSANCVLSTIRGIICVLNYQSSAPILIRNGHRCVYDVIYDRGVLIDAVRDILPQQANVYNLFDGDGFLPRIIGLVSARRRAACYVRVVPYGVYVTPLCGGTKDVGITR